MDSRMGYCFRDNLDVEAPNWPKAAKAKYIQALVSFLNAGGKRVENREWSREQFNDETKTFMLNVQRAIAAEDEQKSAAAWAEFNNAIHKMQEQQMRQAELYRLRSPMTCNFFNNSMSCY